jgi:hypothetical protein
MKYEFASEVTHGRLSLFSPEDEFEARLVFDHIGNALRMNVPYFVERDRDFCNEFRNGGWFAWPFHMKGLFRMNEDPFTLILDVALTCDFEPGQPPIARWCESLGDPSDKADLLFNLNLKYPGRFDDIDQHVLLAYIGVLGGDHVKRRRLVE